MRRVNSVFGALCVIAVGAVGAPLSSPTELPGDTLIAYDLHSGEQHWRRDLPPNTFFDGAVTDGRRIYATKVDCSGFGGDQVVALDARDGDTEWRLKRSLNLSTRESGTGESTVIVTRAGLSGAQALAAETGRKRWGAPVQAPTAMESGPAFFGGPSVVVALPSVQPFDANAQPRYEIAYDIAALDRRTGERAWTFTAVPAPGEYIFTFNFLAADERVVVVEQMIGPLDPGSRGTPSDVIVLDTKTGRERFRFRSENIGGNVPLSELQLVGSTLVYGDEAGVVGRGTTSGEVRWRLDGRRQVVSASKEDRTVYVVDEGWTDQTTLTAVDVATGSERWKTPSIKASNPRAGPGVVVMATPEGMVALEAESGERRWRAPNPEGVNTEFEGLYGFGSVIGFGDESVFVNSSFDCA